MGRCAVIFEKMESYNYDIILSIISNDEVSSDKELVELIVEETGLDKNKIAKFVNKERTNFINGKYLNYKDGLAVVKKYV